MRCSGCSDRRPESRRKGTEVGLAAAAWVALAGIGGPPASPAEREGEPWTPAEVADSDPVEIREWEVPWPGTRPRDPYVAPDGRVWFVGQTGHYVAWLEPGTGEFGRVDLAPGTGPHNLIVGGEGSVWYAGNRAAHIGRVDPASGRIERFPLPEPAGRDPHTLAWGAEGESIWFTVQGGNSVGRLDVASGEARLIPIPTPRARPYGLVVDRSGRPWFTEFGTNRIGTVDPGVFDLDELELPRAEARPRRLSLTSDGAVWYVDYAAGWLGRIDPATREVREWRAPGAEGARPYAMASDDRDRLWFVETGPAPNRLVGFDPATEEFFSVTPIPSGGGAVRHMVFHPPERVLWFGTDAGTVGRARLP